MEIKLIIMIKYFYINRLLTIKNFIGIFICIEFYYTKLARIII